MPAASNVESSTELYEIANRTSTFLQGFYSDFALELLSSIDYLSLQHHTLDAEIISEKLQNWSNRKRSLFSDPKYIHISIQQLQQAQFVD